MTTTAIRTFRRQAAAILTLAAVTAASTAALPQPTQSASLPPSQAEASLLFVDAAQGAGSAFLFRHDGRLFVHSRGNAADRRQSLEPPELLSSNQDESES